MGGVARATREYNFVWAAGYDTIIIETVGIGQSEVAVKHGNHFVLLQFQELAMNFKVLNVALLKWRYYYNKQV